MVDDVRFLNEAEHIKSLGGEVWYIERPGMKSDGSHKSDGALEEWTGFKRRLINNGTIDNLLRTIDSIVKEPKLPQLGEDH